MGKKVKYSNFWDCCPLKRENLPNSECDEGKYNGIGSQCRCAWGINAPEHFNCFWRYVQTRSLPDGSMEPATQGEITRYFVLQPAKTLEFVESAERAMKEAFKGMNAEDLEGEIGFGTEVIELLNEDDK